MPSTEPLYTPQAIAKARRIARDTGRTMAVIEIDSTYESRRVFVVDNEYTHDPEFEAFDGVLIAEVYPDGDVY